MRVWRLPTAIVAAVVLVTTGAIAPAWAVETPGGGTGDGGVDGPANGSAFDIEISADPDPVNVGGTSNVEFTVTNHDVYLAEGADDLLVAISWDPDAFEPVLDAPSEQRWASLADDGETYRFDENGPQRPGSVCVLSGMGRATVPPVGECAAQFRHIGDEPVTGRFSARIVSWADRVTEDDGTSALHPLAINGQFLTSASVDLSVADPPDNGEHFDISIEADPTSVPRADTFDVIITVRNFDVAPVGGAEVLLVSLLWPDGSVVPIQDPGGTNAWRHETDGSFDDRWPEASGDQCLIEGLDEPGPDAIGRCTATLQQRTLPPGEVVLTARIDAWAQVGDYGGDPFLEYIGIGGEYRSSATTTVPVGPSDPPDDGKGFDVAISHAPDVARWGHRFELQVTVTNHGVVPPPTDPENGPVMVAVRLDWDQSAYRLAVEPGTDDGCEAWGDFDSGGGTVVGMGGFESCTLAGLTEPGSTATFNVPFRVAGPRPATSPLDFIATVDQWVWDEYWAYPGYSSLYAPINPATATHAVPVAAPYELTVENYDFLSLGAAGQTEPTLGRYTVYSSEAQLRGLDDAELVVRLSWPPGLILGDPIPDGCEAVVADSLDCTIDDANVIPSANPDVSYDDEYQLFLDSWDLHFVLPATMAERERLSEFAIDFVSGWTYTEPIITIAPGSLRPLGGFGRGIAPMASDPPPGGVVMTPDWTDSDSQPYTILDRVFPTETIASTEYPAPGDEIEVLFRVTHSPEVTTTLPGVEVSVRLDWPTLVVPVGDPLGEPEGCTTYADHVCMIEGLDEPGASVDVTMRFQVPDDAEGSGWFSTSWESVVLVETNADGDIRHEYPYRWVEYSDASITVIADVFVTQVTLDRDRTWPGGDEVLVTVRVQWAKAFPARFRPSRVFTGLSVGWDETRATLVEPPGIDGCDPLDELVCTLQDWSGPGDAKEFTFRLDPKAAGALTVTADAAFVRRGAPTDFDELPTEWLTGDAASAMVVDARFDVDLVLDRNPIYHGGLPMRAKATLTRTPATDGGAGYDPTLPNADAELVFAWPTTTPAGQPTTHLALSATENCPGFAVDTCVKAGLAAVGSTADTTLVFTPPSVGAAHDPHPGTVSVTVERASFDVTRFELPPLPSPPDPDGECDPYEEDCCELGTIECPVDPLPEPIATVERVDAPAEWLGDDIEPYYLLQPVAWFTPAVASPGDVVAVRAMYFPPGEALNAEWVVAHAPVTPAAIAQTFVGGPLGTEMRRDVVVFRWAMQGSRRAEITSPLGTFGAVLSSPVLIAARSGVAPQLVGRGG